MIREILVYFFSTDIINDLLQYSISYILSEIYNFRLQNPMKKESRLHTEGMLPLGVRLLVRNDDFGLAQVIITMACCFFYKTRRFCLYNDHVFFGNA